MSRSTWHQHKVHRKRLAVQAAAPRRLQAAWGPESINVCSELIRILVVELDLRKAVQYVEEARRYPGYDKRCDKILDDARVGFA